jgi:uncharacterized protein
MLMTERTVMVKVTPEAEAKETELKDLMASYGSIAVAYSGGLDSTYLADVAHEILGRNAHIIIADSPSIPRSELAEARELAQDRGWNLHVLATGEFQDEDYIKNDGKRCYFCRKELFTKMTSYTKEHGVAVIAYGAVADDLADATRVGALAAQEFTVASPLQEVQLYKAEIRPLSARRDLPTADKASFACLASRIPTGTPVSVRSLTQVEQAEEVLKGLGFRQYRARHHGELCRIEIDPADFDRLLTPEVREEIVSRVLATGYRFVTLDLGGYRTGSTAAALDTD